MLFQIMSTSYLGRLTGYPTFARRAQGHRRSTSGFKEKVPRSMLLSSVQQRRVRICCDRRYWPPFCIVILTLPSVGREHHWWFAACPGAHTSTSSLYCCISPIEQNRLSRGTSSDLLSHFKSNFRNSSDADPGASSLDAKILLSNLIGNLSPVFTHFECSVCLGTPTKK